MASIRHRALKLIQVDVNAHFKNHLSQKYYFYPNHNKGVDFIIYYFDFCPLNNITFDKTIVKQNYFFSVSSRKSIKSRFESTTGRLARRTRLQANTETERRTRTNTEPNGRGD